MRQSRFPPILSGPSIAAAGLACVLMLVVLFALGSYSPFWLLVREGFTASGTFLIMLALVGALLYSLIAPRLWDFTRRYVPPPQPKLPPDLVVTVLRETPFDCPVCRYSLRGLGTPVCPECSTPVTLYLVGERPASARWNGLVFAWLALTLVVSVLASFVTGRAWFQQYGQSSAYAALYGGGYWLPSYQYGEFRPGLLGVTLEWSVAVGGSLACLYWAVKAFVPKPPHLQSQLARRTTVWLALISAVWILGFGLRMAVPFVLRLWY